MALYGTCPAPSELGDITLSSCPVQIGQVQKVLFQRKYSTGTTENSITIGSANPNLRATWTALESASDGTKVVPSPFLNDPVNEPGEKREFGSGNAVRGGIPIVLGTGPSPFTAKIYSYPQSAMAQMKTYDTENLGVFLIAEDGGIWGLTDDTTTPTAFKPIPVRGFWVSDKVLGGYEGVDTNNVAWSFEAGWSDMLHKVTPSDFDALTAFDA